jgi:hypothetical protein
MGQRFRFARDHEQLIPRGQQDVDEGEEDRQGGDEGHEACQGEQGPLWILS